MFCATARFWDVGLIATSKLPHTAQAAPLSSQLQPHLELRDLVNGQQQLPSPQKAEVAMTLAEAAVTLIRCCSVYL
jgi:hypothetical protein